MQRFSTGFQFCSGLILLLVSGCFCPADWWEHPHDKWYLKDDWKAAAVAPYALTLKLQSRAASGWLVIWGDRGVILRVNGQQVMNHVDRGLIYDADLTPIIKGAIEVRLEAGPGKIVAEGELVDDQDRRYPFASGCDWKVPVAPGTKLPPAAKPHRPGESSGAFHSAHNGLLIRYNDEERGKADISKCLARIQKLRDQSIFILRRFRLPEEILSFSPNALWRRAEHYAATPMAKAESMLKGQAIPAQKQGDFLNAISLAQEAGMLLAAAELAINSARDLEEIERQLQHLDACADLTSTAPPHFRFTHDLAHARNMLAAARGEASVDDWANVQKRLAGARDELSSIAALLAQIWGAPVGKLDEFPEDRFGWLNAQALMNLNMAKWEFVLINPAANWLDLRGRWHFRTDPKNEGQAAHWHMPGTLDNGWRLIKVPSEWEREGVLEDNDYSPWDCPYKLTDLRCEDKPYNGYAWYRREVLVPKIWAGREVRLQIGKVANWLRVFVNGNQVGEPRRDGGLFSIPAGLLRPGQTNSIAIQVYNHDNFGGIVGGPVALFVADTSVQEITTPGPLSYTAETTIKAGDKEEHLVTFASAMSPAVVVASDQPILRLWCWEAKGFPAPVSISLMTSNGLRRVELGTGDTSNSVDRGCIRENLAGIAETSNGLTINGDSLTDSWLLLALGETPRCEETSAKAGLVFMVLERRPIKITWGRNALGFSELALTFAAGGSRLIVQRLEASEKETEATAWAKRARRLRAVPVACSELARLDTPRRQGEFLLQYHYLEMPDFTGQPAERVAPVPMLISYGLKHSYPGLHLVAADVSSELDSRSASAAPVADATHARLRAATKQIVTASCASDYAPYRFYPNTNRLAYATPLIDKSKLLKGVGELFAKRLPEHNARSGNTEQQMFDDWRAWGFDHCRYAFAWGASWDIPLQKFMGGPISNDPQLWARMDSLVKQHADRGIMAMLCYFFNEDSPQRDSKNLVRNSTRYWRMHPEVRANCYELWRRIADRYKDLPDWAVAYDFFNEPAYMHRDDWNQILKDLTRIVRSVDQRHLIVCEAGDGWSQPQWFLWLEPTGDTNTIYSFHHYGKHWGYHYDEYYPGYKWTPEKEIDILLEAILFSIKHHVPIHCGEFGISMISPGEDHLAWLDDYLALFERFGIGWNWWNWSGSDIYRTGLKAGREVSPNLLILRKWIDRKKPFSDGAATHGRQLSEENQPRKVAKSHRISANGRQ